MPITLWRARSSIRASRSFRDPSCRPSDTAVSRRLARPEGLDTPHVRQPWDERLRHFIARYRLLHQEALILSEAERLGARAVVTSPA